MKKLFIKSGEIIACLAFMAASVAANSTCTFVIYQPIMPDGFKKLRKF